MDTAKEMMERQRRAEIQRQAHLVVLEAFERFVITLIKREQPNLDDTQYSNRHQSVVDARKNLVKELMRFES